MTPTNNSTLAPTTPVNAPLTLLPEAAPHQIQLAQFLVVATAGAWFWDYLISIIEEYVMLSTHRIRLPDVCYYLSRLSTAALIILSLIFVSGPSTHCQSLSIAAASCGAFAMPLNSILFFFRARAIYTDSKWTKIFFCLLWLCTLGSFTAPFSISSAASGGGGPCIGTNVKRSFSTGLIIIGIHDTIIYLAISIRLTTRSATFCQGNMVGGTSPNSSVVVKTFVRGYGMSRLSKVLLTSSQLYYLATVTVNLICMIVIFNPSVPAIYHMMLSIPNVTIQNAMACRVYRQLKIGWISEGASTSIIAELSQNLEVRREAEAKVDVVKSLSESESGGC